ncbi:MAG: hypothetical protein DMF04_12885 [Verrucomicrobia bacterium]|nr:MAG: hypothetical protein DMF04_12885 [Verrucomicrobiota bacterium]
MKAKYLHRAPLIFVVLIVVGCSHSTETVSGTIEVDEAHVAPRAGGRVQKVFAREGQTLKTGDPIVELDAAELPAQRDLAKAQVDAAERDTEAQAAQLEFLRADAVRQQSLLKRQAVSPNVHPMTRRGLPAQPRRRKKTWKQRACGWSRPAPIWCRSKRNSERCV